MKSRWLMILSMGLAAAAPCAAQTFTNSTPITIPATGVAGTYPSSITVSGGPASISSSSMVVTLSGVTHANMPDLDILLVGPTGAACLLTSDAGGPAGLSSARLSFANSGRRPTISESYSTGTWHPTDFEPGDAFVAPAPAGPYGADLSVFNSTNANGTWKLFVFDDSATDGGGSIAAWSITFGDFSPSAASTSVTYQGVLEVGGAPANGTADLRFTLWSDQTTSNASDQVAGPIDALAVPVTDGVFTTPVNFGSGVFVMDGGARFIEVAARFPAGTGSYTTLSPRQALTAAPLALAARKVIGSNAGLPVLDGFIANSRIEFRNGYSFRTDVDHRWDIRNSVEATTPDAMEFWFNTENGDGSGSGQEMMQINRTTGPTLRVLNGNTMSLTASAGFFAVGGAFNSAGMIFDTNEIQVRSNDTTAADLFLNRLGGDVGIGVATVTSGFKLEVGGSIRCSALTQTSSARYKRDVADLQGGLDDLLRLRPVRFRWNGLAPGRADGDADVGLIAEEVAHILPEAVAKDSDGSAVGIDYSRVTVLAVEAIRQQHAQVEAQGSELQRLRTDNADLRARLERLEAALGARPRSGPAEGGGR